MPTVPMTCRCFVLSFVIGVAGACTTRTPESAPVEQEQAGPSPESFDITIGEPHTAANGMTVELRSTGHKHRVGGGSMSKWKLRLSKAGVEHDVAYSYSSGGLRWYFEGYVAGTIYAVEELFPLDDDRTALTQSTDQQLNRRRRITLIPHAGAAPEADALEQRALAIAEAEVARRGCATALVSGYSSGSGVLSYSRSKLGGPAVCRVIVGLHTGTVFYRAADGPVLVTRPSAN